MSTIGGAANLNWFQRALTRIRGRSSKKTASVTLPPELLDAILSQIHEQNVLLRCRLVSKQWDKLICNLLEQRQLSHWTTWELCSEIPALSICTPKLFNKLCLVCVDGEEEFCDFHHGSVVRLSENSHSLLHHQMKSGDFNDIVNPFPAKAVTILGTLLEMSHNPSVCQSLPTHGSKMYEVRWDFFFEIYGKYLTSLALHGVEIRKSNLYLLLTNAQNLKALSLHVFALKMGVNFKMLEETVHEGNSFPNIKISPHLTSLQLFYIPNGVANLILSFCCQQLVNLTIVTKHGFGFPKLNQRKFPSLKQLKIYSPAVIEWFAVFWEPENIPKLKRLSIIVDDRKPTSRPELESVSSFITQFSESLVCLRLNVKVAKFVELWGAFGAVFSKLEELSVMKSSEGDSLEESPFKKGFLDWFPTLKNVNFEQMANKVFAKGNSFESLERGRSNLVNANIVCPTCKAEPYGYSLVWEYCLD